jgi:chromosome partitioning protein
VPQAAVDELKKAQLPIIEPYISSSVKMKESHMLRKPLVFLEPKHKLSQQFVDIYNSFS